MQFQSKPRPKSRHQNEYFLLPRLYVYLGVAIFFIAGILLGAGYTQSQFNRHISTSFYTSPVETVLVTGGLGFIGSHVVDDLLTSGYHVIIYDDMSNGRNFNKGASAILLRDITIISDFQYITQKIDYIVHLAAAISVEESTRLPEKYERINVEGSRKVLEYAYTHGIKRVVAASSGATYGIPLPENLPLKEEDATGGICPYATTKFAMEKLMQEYNVRYKLPSTALRFFNVYGPRQDPHSSYSGVVSWFMEEARIGGNLKVTGTGEQYRDFVYVKDVARAIRIAMTRKDPNFDVFNVCTGEKTTVNTMAKTIVQTFNSSAIISHIPFRQGDVNESVCSPEKATNLLGFTYQYALPHGIAETRDWFLSGV